MMFDAAPILLFAGRAQVAANSRAREVRMSVEDALSLSASLCALLARLASLEGASPTASPGVRMDGGGLAS